MSKLPISLLLLVSSSVFADDWSRADSYRQAAYLTLHTADWLQTRQIVSVPGKCYREGYTGCYELNPILGKNPSAAKVNAYFALTGLAHYLIAEALPAEYREVFQYVTIGVQFGVVAHNYSMGISVRF